jgi:hypothetical protein
MAFAKQILLLRPSTVGARLQRAAALRVWASGHALQTRASFGLIEI